MITFITTFNYRIKIITFCKALTRFDGATPTFDNIFKEFMKTKLMFTNEFLYFIFSLHIVFITFILNEKKSVGNLFVHSYRTVFGAVARNMCSLYVSTVLFYSCTYLLSLRTFCRRQILETRAATYVCC